MWAYLLSPTFEIVNSAGKPATGGWIEVYISGSRDKYYCASDFDGTLHPFKIPLDSLGSNIVLADDSKAYDVYIYNRYGSLLMSRYSVTPGGGGGLTGTITSTDGSIIITETEDGLDLRVNGELPTSMRCTAEDLLVDGSFQFAELERDGQNASVSNYKVLLNEGWWHYDATVRLQWNGATNSTTPVQLYTAGSSDSMDFDLSYAHSETVQVSGEQKITVDGTQFVLGVTGIPSGMQVSLVDFGIHSITGEGAGGKYNAGTGIDIDEPNRVISVDFDDVQAKLTAGTGIAIDGNNEISVDTTVVATQEDLATKQDVISDLSDIRAGAAAGATAVQPAALNDYATTTDLTTGLAGKQDTLTAGSNITITNNVISASAAPQEQADWAETDNTKVDYIKNKPDISGMISSALSDYTPTASLASVALSGNYDDLLDKPDLSVYATTSDLTTGLAGKQDTISDLSDIRSGAALGATAVQPAALNDYATTSDLTNGLAGKQDTLTAGSNITISNNVISASAAPQEQADWAETDNTKVDYIKNKPTIPTVPTLKELVAGSNITITEGTTEVTIAATVPSVPVTDVEVGGYSVVNAQGVAEVPAQVNADWNAVSGAAQVLNKPALASVALSGDYTDLIHTPSIPTIGTITI